MYLAQFTEFSYGYTLTDNILHSGLPHSPHAPVFPSLFAEGSSGGGYDVQIPLRPVPIFLQFKIPQVVRRWSEQTPPGFGVPYLRMHLRTKRPNQHKLLLNLESTGKLVYYATPDFWTTHMLDEHFASNRVHEHSWYIRPTQIGRLNDQPHYVAYRLGNDVVWRHSKLKRLEGHFDGKNFARELDEAVKTAKPQESLWFLQRIKHDIEEISLAGTTEMLPQLFGSEPTAQKGSPKTVETPETRAHSDTEQHRLIRQAMREVAYLSQVRLGCSFLITGTN